MQHFIKNVFIIFLTLIFIAPNLVFAQTTPSSFLNLTSQDDFDKLPSEKKEEIENYLEEVNFNPSTSTRSLIPAQLANTVNCFDYYNFGSVQVDLVSVTEQTIPGVPITFAGKLKNSNPYPIVDGSVYVKIFRTDETDKDLIKQNGYQLVDFFEAGKNIIIPAGTDKDFSFSWLVPKKINGGLYEADFFFVTNNRFNLLGLSFTDDVTGNKAPFKITSNSVEQVYFDKNSVTLNEQTYSFASFPKRFPVDEPVTISVDIKNPTDTPKEVGLDWELYNWDGLRDESLIDSSVNTLKLGPNETKTVSYVASEYTGAVSYIKATLTDDDASSIINTRFVREGAEEARIGYSSLMTYPIKNGIKNTFFACLHSTNLPVVTDMVFTLDLIDADTQENIHSYRYVGGVTGEMMGVKDFFIPTYTPRRVTLNATLLKNNKVIDSVSQTYDCEDIDSESCPEIIPAANLDVKKESINLMGIVLIVVMLIMILSTLYFSFIGRTKVIKTNIN